MDELEKEARRLLKNAGQREGSREGMRKLREQRKALSEAEVKGKLALTEEDFETLEEIIKAPKRNAMAQLAALRMKAQFTVAQPKVEVGGEVGVRVVINTLAKAAMERNQVSDADGDVGRRLPGEVGEGEE